LRRSPLSEAHPDILVVEVKQYKESKKSNFVAAIEDYAFGCPNAQVLLANYGPGSAGTINAIPASRRARAAPLGDIRPDHNLESQQLRETIARVVQPSPRPVSQPSQSTPAPAIAVPDAPSIPLAGRFHRVELIWGPVPRDLDLHIFEGRPCELAHVYY